MKERLAPEPFQEDGGATIGTTLEKLITRLSSTSEAKREAALMALQDMEPARVIPPVAQLLIDDANPHTQAACLDLLERFGVVASFRESRADGWFERFGEQIASFGTICEVLGARFLAYAVILGIQIRTLTRDPRVPANNTVEFTGEDDLLQVLTVGEFRGRLVQALMQTEPDPPAHAPVPIDEATAVAALGPRFLLLAPLFKISLRQLVWVDDPREPWAVVGFISGSGFSFMALRSFHDFIKQKLRRDLAGTLEEPFQLDLTAVEQAREAAREGDHARVINALETWPGLLATLQRTAAAQRITEDQLSIIAEGLLLLGDAFRAVGRLTWSEELYRMGLQFLKEGPMAARLFASLGALLSELDRHGEAIGLLRRAQSLGGEERELIPILGHSFYKREKNVAAVLLLERAVELGVDDPQVAEDLAELRKKFAGAGVVWPI